MRVNTLPVAADFDLWSPHHIHEYQPYWIDKAAGLKNPKFTKVSGQLLDLKKPTNFRYSAALVMFSKSVAAVLPQHLAQNKIYTVVAVPSHAQGQHSHGLVGIVANICHNNPHLVDAARMLERHTTVAKAAHGGSRAQSVHLGSIRIAAGHSTQGKHIVLLDDIATTENTMCACRQILLNAGAVDVVGIALAKTTHA